MSVESKRDIPLYIHTRSYASEHGELDEYRSSYKANIACTEAIEKAINDNYSNNRLDVKATRAQIGHEFSNDRIAFVLANTILQKPWDVRFSKENREWATTIPVPQDVDPWKQDRNAYFVIDQAHSGLVNIFVNHMKNELNIEKEAALQKPSVLAKLQPNIDSKSSAISKPAKDKTVSL